MDFENVTFQGPSIDDPDILAEVPAAHRELLEHINGLIAFGGGLHIRGACHDPPWHSLRRAWRGPHALCTKFRALTPSDIPFAQDVFGDQFVVREDVVWRLDAETGEMEPLGAELIGFLEAACDAPIDFLGLAALERFWSEGGTVAPGQLLNVYPPFVVRSEGVPSLRVVLVDDRLGFLASLAAQIEDLPDGTEVEFKIVE